MKALSIFLTKAWLLALLSFLGCAHNNPVIEGQEITSQASLRPIDADPSIAENIGREALQKIGYEEIVRLAEKAGFVAYKSDVTIQLVSYGSAASTGFVPVFSRYAAAAAVTSQADSPLPGPADIAAVGVVVIGLVDAGLLDGYLLNTLGGWLFSKAKNDVATGPAKSAVGSGRVASDGEALPRPEAKYLGTGKHGLGWTEGSATARSLGKPQGQWGSKSDLDYAAEKAGSLKPGEGQWFDLPEGHSSVVHRPDGTSVPARRFWVRNNGTGTFHAYPAE